jgi:HAE1 family hydrophobic/amphiphilic exporter-1
MSLMGVVMMMGIVVSNSILIVEFARHLRQDGVPLLDAVIDRLPRASAPHSHDLARHAHRPRLPMALALGTGSEAYAPLARAIIGGLGVSVVLTIFVVPAAYLIAHRRREIQPTRCSLMKRLAVILVLLAARRPCRR